jgi:hypothetical protein
MTAKGSLPTPLDTALRQQARTLWEAGESYASIEAELGIRPSTLKSWRKRDAWARSVEPAAEPVVIVPVEDAEPIDDDLEGRQIEYIDRLSRTAVRFARYVDSLDGETVTRIADKIMKSDKTARAALKLDVDRPVPVIQLAVLCGDSPPRRAIRKTEKPLHSAVRPALPESED